MEVEESRKLKQPKMRFKPRNDAERVIDSMNMNTIYGGDNHLVASKQAELITRNKLTRQVLAKKSIKMLRMEEEERIKAKARNFDHKEQKTIKKKRNGLAINVAALNRIKEAHFNSEFAKKLLNTNKEIKTHFKAAIDYTFTQTSQAFLNMKQKSTRNIFDLNEETTEENNNVNEANEFYKKINKNPMSDKEEAYDVRSLEKLKGFAFNEHLFKPKERKKLNLSFVKRKKVKQPSGSITKEILNPNLFSHLALNSIAKDSEMIKIGDEMFEKSQLDKIATKMLHKCNFFHEKNKNSNKPLKKGEGKLCFTNGMTINEFSKTIH